MMRRFKMTFTLSSGRKSKDYHVSEPTFSVIGAYRPTRDEFFGSYQAIETPSKPPPSAMKITPPQQNPPLRQTKSTHDLTRDKNLPPHIRNSTPNVSSDPRGAQAQLVPVKPPRNSKDAGRDKIKSEKLDKKRVAEQRARDKLAAQEQAKQEKQRQEREKKMALEQAKQEKIRLEREKKMAQEQAKQEKLRLEREKQAQKQAKNKKKDKKAPAAPIAPALNPLAQQPRPHSTNTLESSISKSSGPPPYSEVNPDIVKNENDNSGNTSFGGNINEADSSWDLISQHRQEVARPPGLYASNNAKQTVMDLNYEKPAQKPLPRISVCPLTGQELIRA